jgi:multiple sugar transport system permease protein
MRQPGNAHSVVAASARGKTFAAMVVIVYALVTSLPIVWIFMTSFKTQEDAIAYPPVVLFHPSLEGYVNLFTIRSRQTPEFIASLPPATTWYERDVRKRNMVIAGPSKVLPRFVNSLVIGFGSTFLAVFHSLYAHDAAHRRRDPDLPDVSRARTQ